MFCGEQKRPLFYTALNGYTHCKKDIGGALIVYLAVETGVGAGVDATGATATVVVAEVSVSVTGAGAGAVSNSTKI